MRQRIYITDICAVMNRINRLGKEFGFTIYILINGNHIEVHRHDGELICKHYITDSIGLTKTYEKLLRLRAELEEALLGNIYFHGKYKMKYLIYFNF